MVVIFNLLVSKSIMNFNTHQTSVKLWLISRSRYDSEFPQLGRSNISGQYNLKS